MTEEAFVRELQRRAGYVQSTPLSPDDVCGRARSIQRRRRTAAAGVVAAAVAVVVILPTALAGGPAPSTPQPAPAPPAADTPGVSVLHDGVLTRRDGSTVPLDVDTADVQQFGVLTDGRIVVAGTRPYGVQIYSPDGELESEHQVALNAITMSPDDTLVTWVDETFRVVVLESGVARPITYDNGVPVSGSLDAVFGSDCAAGGCTVLGGDYATTTTEVTPTANRELATSEPLRVAAISQDGQRWAVTFPPSDDSQQFGCSGLYATGAAKVVARNCDTTLWQFSPDGAHLTGARGDNAMWGSVEVLDENLDLVLSYEPGADQRVTDWGWADPDHLLVVVVAAGRKAEPEWSLVRIPIDGSQPEVVAGPVPGPNADQRPVYLVSD